MKRSICKGVLLTLILVLSWPVFALEEIVGKLTYLEATYMPGTIRFTMSGGSSSCPAGSAIFWKNSDMDNNKIVYSTLLSALMAGQNIRIYINDGDTTCEGKYIHIVPNS